MLLASAHEAYAVIEEHVRSRQIEERDISCIVMLDMGSGPNRQEFIYIYNKNK